MLQSFEHAKNVSVLAINTQGFQNPSLERSSLP